MMAPEFKTTFLSLEEDSLQHLADLLHLFNHRNKNQHRRSHWWRHFDIFRRQLKALVGEIHKLNAIPATNLAKTKKKSSDKILRQQVQQRLTFWQDVMVSKWERAFSQIIADGRFAVLGLVLTAVLAEVCQVTGITAHLEDLGQAQIESVLATFGEEWQGSESDLPKIASGINSRESTVKLPSTSIKEEDVGEAVERPESSPDRRDELGIENAQISNLDNTSQVFDAGAEKLNNKERSSTSAKTTKSKKRKKGSSTIDDLFAGLL